MDYGHMGFFILLTLCKNNLAILASDLSHDLSRILLLNYTYNILFLFQKKKKNFLSAYLKHFETLFFPRFSF